MAKRNQETDEKRTWSTWQLLTLVLVFVAGLGVVSRMAWTNSAALGGHVENQKQQRAEDVKARESEKTAEAKRTAQQRGEDLAWRARIELKLDEALKRPATP